MPKSGQPWNAGLLTRSPLLRHHGEIGRPLMQNRSWPALEAYTALAESERRTRAAELAPVRFAPAPKRRRRARAREPLDISQLYDARIALAREVPCVSASYHDLLNAVAWAAFPRAKRALHARQFRALRAALEPGAVRLPNRRTREQDALTLLDEGGSVLVTTPALALALGCPRETSHLVADDAHSRVVLFGHALMEHVSTYETQVRSATLLVCAEGPLPEGRGLLELVDLELARRLADGRQFQRPAYDQVLIIEPPATVWV